MLFVPVENGAARHTHDTSFVQIASREWLRICAEDSGIWLRLWAFGLYVRESIENVGMRDSFGIVQLSGKPGGKRERAGSPEVGKCLSFF